MNDKVEQLLKLIKENPDLPVVPMVDGDIVGSDNFGWWLGRWGRSKVTKYYDGRDAIHFEDDDRESVISDMKDCKYGMTADGRDIYDLTDEEWERIYNSLPWVNAIVVYITT